ncbi:glucosamine inositolphosphorylceramide transferase family protein [Brucella sp. IR073]|uniref:glucosamine inositolphosphorylceramide transferase family protein n=1 Tax=unclassified Brucella TaxID=2632610 RepID=UPI003B985642
MLLPVAGCRLWQNELVARLVAAGHAVSVRHGAAATPEPVGLRTVLALEARRFGASLASLCAPLPVDGDGQADLVIDLTSGSASQDKPVMTLRFCGQKTFPAGLAAMVANGGRAELAVAISGTVVARGRPMIQDRLWLTRAADNLLAGAVSLIMQAVAIHRTSSEVLGLIPATSDGGGGSGISKHAFALSYPRFLARGIAERAAEKLKRRPFYWQVAYRRIDGPGIAETGKLDGPEFTVLPDDGQRFYADPFLFEKDGRVYLLVEEFPYARGRGIISASELRDDGTFETPQPVLEEPHHLSYPQVFAKDGEIYMIPESAAARELVLYRAAQFPHRWVRDTVLISDIEINDATLFEMDGTFWLIGTQRFGYGSASDTMVAYSAPALRGPWAPHALNPLAIDHSAARPGGAFIRQGDEVLLPVQDGSQTYGGGLGLMQLERLDHGAVSFSPPRPILPGPAWNRKGIHTLNRAGGIEVIDSCG